jgi:hypothetical protein
LHPFPSVAQTRQSRPILISMKVWFLLIIPSYYKS